MREIKFRAWDRKAKHWYKGDESCLTVSEHGALYEITPDGAGWDIKEKYDVCFFTGLKDKNGEEIYEGDVLKRKDTSEMGSVIYKPSVFCLDLRVQSPILAPWINDAEFEVIGNIYENPELITNT